MRFCHGGDCATTPPGGDSYLTLLYHVKTILGSSLPEHAEKEIARASREILGTVNVIIYFKRARDMFGMREQRTREGEQSV